MIIPSLCFNSRHTVRPRRFKIQELFTVCLVACFHIPAIALVEFGPGGGGAVPVIVSKPGNPNYIIAASNMGLLAATWNGGTNWYPASADQIRAVNYTHATGQDWTAAAGLGQLKSSIAWCLSATKPNRVFAGCQRGFYLSEDDGASWIPVPAGGNWAGNAGYSLQNTSVIGPQIISCPLQQGPILAAFNHFATDGNRELLGSWDDGTTWWAIPLPPTTMMAASEVIIDVMVDEMVLGTNFVLVTNRGVYYHTYTNGIDVWTKRVTGLPVSATRKIVAFSGTSRQTPAQQALYITLESVVSGGGITASIYKSINSGQIWTPCGTSGLVTSVYTAPPNPGVVPSYAEIAVARSNPNVVYVCYEGGVTYGQPTPAKPAGNGGIFKSSNGGVSWGEVFFTHDDLAQFIPNIRNLNQHTWLTGNDWDWAQKPDAVSVDPLNASNVFTGHSGIQRSLNGGATWDDLSARALVTTSPVKTVGGAFPVLTVWDIAQHPTNRSRLYQATTDFPFFHSYDAGATWVYRDVGFNNIYSVATNTASPNQVWLAGAFTHDIPTWSYLRPSVINNSFGGLAYTTNDWASHTVVQGTNGLPNNACTSVWVAPGTGNIWVAVMGHGFYMRPAAGTTWTEGASETPLTSINSHAYKVGGTPEGGMFAIVTASAGETINGTFYPPISGAIHLRPTQTGAWRQVAGLNLTVPSGASSIYYPVDLQMASTGPGTGYIFVACMSNSNTLGGVYRSAYTWNSSAGYVCGAWVKIIATGCTSVTVSPTFTTDNDLYACLMDGYFPWLANNFGVYVSGNAIAATPTFARRGALACGAPLKVRFMLRPDGTQQMCVTSFGQGVWKN